MSSYFSSLGPAALQASVSGTVDLDAFGHGVQEWVAVMSKLALCCKEADPNSADAEQLLWAAHQAGTWRLWFSWTIIADLRVLSLQCTWRNWNVKAHRFLVNLLFEGMFAVLTTHWNVEFLFRCTVNKCRWFLSFFYWDWLRRTTVIWNVLWKEVQKQYELNWIPNWWKHKSMALLLWCLMKVFFLFWSAISKEFWRMLYCRVYVHINI